MLRVCVGVIALASVAYSLDLKSVEEGHCLPYKPAQNVNMTWFANAALPYVSAGSKFNIYALASSHPQFSQIREYELYYESCLMQYSNMTSGTALIYGFGGGIIGNYYMKPASTKGVFDIIPLPGMQDTVRATITLTDNKEFVFFANCLMGENQKGWHVMSLTPTLSMKNRKLIQDHAESLGFSREQFVFLRYESCSASSPVPGSYSADPSEKAVGGKTSQAKLFEKKMRG